jgi:hypothetical protein
VTEAEWLAATDLEPMLEFLKGRASGRKMRLFACACCRRIWHLLDEELFRRLVGASEEYADRSIRKADLVQRRIAALRLASSIACQAALATAQAECSPRWVALLCRYAATGRTMPPGQLLVPRRSDIPDASPATMVAWMHECASQVAVLRDIFGSVPFHTVPFDPTSCFGANGRVAQLGRTVYQEGAFHRVPLLADTLEDAGCTDAELLGHLRGPGPHVRGCWAVDLIRDKS